MSVEQCPITGGVCKASGVSCTEEEPACMEIAKKIADLYLTDMFGGLKQWEDSEEENIITFWLNQGGTPIERLEKELQLCANVLGVDQELLWAQGVDSVMDKPGQYFKNKTANARLY